MKVVLIHPPHPNSTDDRLDPPLGLMIIASHLREDGYQVEILDLSGQSELVIPYADYYGITAYISTVSIAYKIISLCKEKNPKSIVVVDGAHPSACPEDFSDADHIVIGPGEVALARIITKQVWHKVVLGTESKTPFLMPAYNLVDLGSYSRVVDGERSVPILTSRGCPFKCSFCGLANMGSGVRMADPEVVYSQIRILKESYGISRFNIQDDIFTFNKKRLYKILDLIKPLGIKFRCMGRAGYATGSGTLDAYVVYRGVQF